ncbi:hypothetical protein REPUB_Repub20aG0059500 [Reevesia pubescens]
MEKETGRKCSVCGHNGHNSRTCDEKVRCVVKLFGVNIVAIEKRENLFTNSFSMGTLQSHAETSNGGVDDDDGYLSEGQTHIRKPVKRWSEEEHILFLEGLRKLGKGDWRGISKNYVTTRTPTQVASHAQKYFLRQSGRNRKPNLFDMTLPESESDASPSGSPSEETTGNLPQITNAPSQIVNRFPHPCLDERPRTLLTAPLSFRTYYHRIQPMAGLAPNGQGYPQATMMQSLPYLHPMNSVMPPYGYMANPFENVAVRAPVANPSAVASPSLVQHSMFRAGPGASSTEKDPLELKIGPPQSSKSSSLPSQSSITVI